MNLTNLLDITAFSPKSLQPPNAWVGHLPFAAWAIKEFSPKIFVELGTHYGNSYFSFCQSVVENGLSTKCYAVDTWQGDEHAGQYTDEVFAKVNAHHQERYAEFSRLLRMTFDDAVAYFADESIDLLHIDGLHTYEAVCHDFDTWLPKLAPGAVVMFHDTNVRERNFGVWKLWEELQARYPNNIEFVHSHGLGVLQLNNASDAKKLYWLQPNFPEKQRLINYFAALGSRQLDRFDLIELKQHVSNLNDAIAERDGQIVNLNQTIAERDGQIANLNQTITERDGQITAITVRYTEALKTIEEIRRSSSWRLTAPIRYAFSKAKNVVSLLKLLPSIIRFGGGVMESARKAWRVFLREGWSGVKRRILFVGGNRNGLFNSMIRPDLISSAVYRNDYAEWVRRYDTLTDNTRAAMRLSIDAFDNKPVISVIMPTYNPKSEWLIEAIESVRKQIYTHWELCIADDASTNKSIRPILERYAKEDSRIKIVFREKNGHISEASNSALELANGTWLALLDHDDLLPEHALFWVADAINKNPDVRLIYSDEDKIDEAGKRFGPYFKCDWNLDLFYSHNLYSHLGAYQASLVSDIGGFRKGFEGSQDYDLALRCIERVNRSAIYHIPRVLYHWRVHAESTALKADAKPYAMIAGERAINDHFQRLGISAKATLVGHGYRVQYALPKLLPMVSLIIPTRNAYQLIYQCIESIRNKTTYQNYEILIVDNGSDDSKTLKYFKSLESDPQIRILRDDGPFNYSALNNAAVKEAKGELIGLINNDIEVISPDWLSEMVSQALRNEVGAVGARLWYPDNTLQHGGLLLGVGGIANSSHRKFARNQPDYFSRSNLIQSFSAVTAACLVIKKSIYEEIGGLNEIDLQVAFNDVDFCLRVRESGYCNIWTPYAELYHHESATRGFEDNPEKQIRFAKEVEYMKQRWGDLLLNDPAYSPNLSLNEEDFSLAWPPRVRHL
ncbi:MAG: glycosyltransferase [Methylobacter sp.]